jgi:hypothetical protein
MISLLDIQHGGFLGKIVFETCIHWEYHLVSRCQCDSIGVTFDKHEIIGKTVKNYDLIDNKNHVSLIFNFVDGTSWKMGNLFGIWHCNIFYIIFYPHDKWIILNPVFIPLSNH